MDLDEGSYTGGAEAPGVLNPKGSLVAVNYTKETVTGPRHAGALTTAGGVLTDRPVQLPSSVQPRLKRELPGRGVRSRITRAWRLSYDALEGALDNEDDLIARGNELFAFRDAMAQLWEEREHREDAFAIVVNRLQTTLLGLNIALITRSRIEALRDVVAEARFSCPLSHSDIRRFGAVLDKAGCNVFTELRPTTDNRSAERSSD